MAAAAVAVAVAAAAATMAAVVAAAAIGLLMVVVASGWTGGRTARQAAAWLRHDYMISRPVLNCTQVNCQFLRMMAFLL